MTPPEASVKLSECEAHRKEIYAAIFPRWAAIGVMTMILGILGIFLARQWIIDGKADSAVKTVSNVDTKFTERVESVREDLTEIKGELRQQRAILLEIERHMNGD